MDTIATMNRVLDETRRIVNNVSPDQLDNPTPCTDWSVRDVINHVTGGSRMFAISAEQGKIPDEVLGQIMGDNLGDDYKGAFNSALDEVASAFSAPGVLEKTVELPFGTMPASVALNIAVFDVTTHACDLAKATNQSIQDTEILESALAAGKEMIGPEWRQPGMFDAEQQIGDDAPITDRLLAFAGRKVS